MVLHTYLSPLFHGASSKVLPNDVTISDDSLAAVFKLVLLGNERQVRDVCTRWRRVADSMSASEQGQRRSLLRPFVHPLSNGAKLQCFVRRRPDGFSLCLGSDPGKVLMYADKRDKFTLLPHRFYNLFISPGQTGGCRMRLPWHRSLARGDGLLQVQSSGGWKNPRRVLVKLRRPSTISGHPDDIMCLNSKAPKRTADGKAWSIGFEGDSVRISSCKNMQLVLGLSGDSEARVVLQFGKHDTDGLFTLDFDPCTVSAIQAFGIALTAFGSFTILK